MDVGILDRFDDRTLTCPPFHNQKTNTSISGNTAQWLLHGILDHTVDRLLPIVEAYQIRVAHFHDQLHRLGAAFGKTQTSAVMDTKLDLLWIHRRVAVLKPLLKHLLRTVPADLQLYYQVRRRETPGIRIDRSIDCLPNVHRNES